MENLYVGRAFKNILNTNNLNVVSSDIDSVSCLYTKSSKVTLSISISDLLNVYKEGLVNQAIYALGSDALLFKQLELWQYPMCINKYRKYIYLCDKSKDESEQYRTFAKEFNQFGLVGVFCEIGN